MYHVSFFGRQLCLVSRRQVLVGVSVDLALGLLKFILSDTEGAALCWTSAVAMAHEAGIPCLAQGVVRLLLPTGIVV